MKLKEALPTDNQTDTWDIKVSKAKDGFWKALITTIDGKPYKGQTSAFMGAGGSAEEALFELATKLHNQPKKFGLQRDKNDKTTYSNSPANNSNTGKISKF